MSLATTGTAIFATGQQFLLDGLTMVRTRGELQLQVSVLPGFVVTFFEFAVGLCIVTENAADVGATAIPDPVVDSGWEGWIWHQFGVAGIGPGVGAVVDRAIQYEVDSKAMRKIRSTDVIVAVLGGEETGTAGTITGFMDSRILVKLP